MKKEYFIEQNGKKEGAFTLEELKQKDIYDSALIWKAGWEEWKKALEVEELEGFVIITPPPTAKEKDKIIKVEKKNAFIEKMKASIPMFLLVTVLLNALWNFLYYDYAKNGGIDLFPIYLTNEEQLDPSLIFWNMLPANTLLVTGICLVVWFLVLYIRKDKNKDVKNINLTNHTETDMFSIEEKVRLSIIAILLIAIFIIYIIY